MPAVGAFFAKLGTGIIASFAGAGAAAAVSTGIAIAVGVSTVVFAAVSLRQASKLRNLGDAGRVPNHQIMVRGTLEPRKIVYGQALVSGPVTYANSSGEELRELYYEIALTGHEIDSYISFRVDDRVIPIADVDDINSAGDGSVDSDTNDHGLGPVDGTPVAYLRGHLGTSTQAVDSQLDSAFTAIDSNHRHRGCARLNMRFDFLEGAEEVWDNRAPQNGAAEIKAKLVYDPRLDSTFSGDWGTGSGSHRLATPSTWEWSDNPALCLADYLIDSTLGPGWDSSRIDYNSVAEAADDCDVSVDVPTAATEKRFTCNGVLLTTDTHETNINKILSSMDGKLRYFGGSWKIEASVWRTTDFSLDEDDLIDAVTWRKQPDRGDRFNMVKGEYFDPDRNHKSSAFLQVESSTLQTNRDNGRELPKDLPLPMTNGEYEAQRLAFRYLNQAANTGILVFPTGYQGMNVRVGDTGTVTLAELGFSAKTFRCVGVEHQDFVGVKLILKEDSSSAYDDPAEGEYGTRTAAGVIEFPKHRRDATFDGGSLIADPFFQRSTNLWDGTGFSAGDQLRYFWKLHDPGNGTVAIARTGGVRGGVLRFSNLVTAGNMSATSVPRSGSQFVTGEYIRLNLRVRKTASTTLTDASIIASCGAGDGDGAIDVVGSGSQISIDEVAINAWTVNEWQEFETTFQIQNVSKAQPQKPFVNVSVSTNNFTHEVPIEVDALNATRIASP